jgi:uncharacterized membrane protein
VGREQKIVERGAAHEVDETGHSDSVDANGRETPEQEPFPFAVAARLGQNERMLAWGLALAACVWCAALVAGPELPSWLGGPLYAAASLVCHQRPERSFHVQGVQLPVCARCLGIYAGAALGALTVVSIGSTAARASPRIVRADEVAPRAARWLVAAGALPTGLTVMSEWAGVWPVSNDVRAAAGLMLGLTVGFVVAAAVGGLRYRRCASRRPTAPSPPPAPI